MLIWRFLGELFEFTRFFCILLFKLWNFNWFWVRNLKDWKFELTFNSLGSSRLYFCIGVWKVGIFEFIWPKFTKLIKNWAEILVLICSFSSLNDFCLFTGQIMHFFVSIYSNLLLSTTKSRIFSFMRFKFCYFEKSGSKKCSVLLSEMFFSRPKILFLKSKT
jgi:hypothetical protein